MIYLFSSQSATIERYFKEHQILYELVDKERYGVFLQTYIPQIDDWGIVYDFGKIIPEDLLQRLLLLNIHFSLLPKYRGAIPVEAAILAGEKKTGITVQKMAKGMDSGDILVQREVEINSEWCAGELQRYMDALLPEVLESVFATPRMNWVFTPQEGEPTFCYIKELDKSCAELDFASMTASEIMTRIRAYNPEPLAWSQIKRNGKLTTMNILRARVDESCPSVPSKELVFIKGKGLCIGTKTGSVLVTELIVSGSKLLRNGDIVSLKGGLELP